MDDMDYKFTVYVNCGKDLADRIRLCVRNVVEANLKNFGLDMSYITIVKKV